MDGEKSLLNFIRSLTNLRRLSLNQVSCNKRPEHLFPSSFFWKDMDAIISKPDYLALSVVQGQLWARLCSGAKNLKSLKIRRCSFPTPKGIVPLRRHYCPFTSFTPLKLRSLRHLHIQHSCFEEVAELVGSFCQTLETLHLNCLVGNGYFPFPPLSSLYPRLSSLQLQIQLFLRLETNLQIAFYRSWPLAHLTFSTLDYLKHQMATIFHFLSLSSPRHSSP